VKRPEKIIKWLHVDRKPHEPFVDHNGKPAFNYFIELPYWIAKAYNPQYAKIEIRQKPLSYADMVKEENRDEAKKYLKENWSDKIAKMYKMNHGYLLISAKAMGQGWFKSIEDFNNYHKELVELNEKYGLLIQSQEQEKQP
jgi:hypothetical protein